MHSRKAVPIIDLMNAANMELIRLDFKSSTLSRHNKEFRSFSNYCRENEITAYDTEIGPQYFQHRYGLDIGDPTAKLTKQQLDTRCSIRFLDDIFQFGYALRYSHHDYTMPRQYVGLLEEYLAWCHRNNSSAGTIRVKRTKMRQFFCFLDGRGIELSDLTAAEISDFMTTLCRYRRATIHVFSSVLRDFFRYLHENGISDVDLSPSVPRPKIYVEENIPETWSPEEVRQLIYSAISRTLPLLNSGASYPYRSVYSTHLASSWGQSRVTTKCFPSRSPDNGSNRTSSYSGPAMGQLSLNHT